jgi:hypothetical protein
MPKTPEEFDLNGTVEENITNRIQEEEELKQEMASMKTVDELLDRAEVLVPNADPFLLAVPNQNSKYSESSHSFIIEAWKRIKEMPNGEERRKLQKRADDLYGKFLDIAQSGPK